MSALWIHLPAASVFRVSGKDARRYLNNRLTNDLRSVRAGASLEAAALNPQGRVEGLFTVFVESDESFVLVCDGGRRNTILAALSRYIVADRVSIEDVSSYAALIHCCGANLPVSSDALIFSCARLRVAAIGHDYLIHETELHSVTEYLKKSLGSPVSPGEYDLLRWRCGYAAFPTEVNEELILTEAGLRNAVSFSKGCYVGQEVIERSDAIGKLPRKLERVVIHGAAADISKSQVSNLSGQVIGKIVSSFGDIGGGMIYAFALLRNGSYSQGDAIKCGSYEGVIVDGSSTIKE
jgi:hypothetical protein